MRRHLELQPVVIVETPRSHFGEGILELAELHGRDDDVFVLEIQLRGTEVILGPKGHALPGDVAQTLRHDRAGRIAANFAQEPARIGVEKAADIGIRIAGKTQLKGIAELLRGIADGSEFGVRAIANPPYLGAADISGK